MDNAHNEQFYKEMFPDPLPSKPIDCIKRLAYDLAYGAINRVWSTEFSFRLTLDGADTTDAYAIPVDSYFQYIWNNQQPDLKILHALGYLLGANIGPATYKFMITQKAFDLLNNPPQLSIFISYRRQTSSAFAMLIWAELRHLGLNPYLDIYNLELGDQWHGILKRKVDECTLFIPIITHDTFSEGSFVINEVQWALEKRLNDENSIKILPILHSNYTFDDLKTIYPDLAELNNIPPIREDVAPNFYDVLNRLKEYLNLIR